MKQMPRILLCAGLVAAAVGAPADVLTFKDIDSQAVSPRSLDLTQIDVFRTPDEQLAFKLYFSGPADSPRVRLLFDTRGPNQGEPTTGAEFMIEGSSLFRYPDGGVGWTWDEIAPPLVLSEGRTITYILPPVAELGYCRWYAETMHEDLTGADRYPQQGTADLSVDSLPVIVMSTPVASEDVGELVACSPTSLSLRLEADIRSVVWEPAEEGGTGWVWRTAFLPDALPLRMKIRDAVSGAESPLEPSRRLFVEGRSLWTGLVDGVQWDLVTEALSDGCLRVTGQLKAADDRCLRLEIGCEVGLDGWSWQAGLRNTVAPIESRAEMAWDGTGPAPLPFALLSGHGGWLAFEPFLDEPRAVRAFADPAKGFAGFLYDLGVTPVTSNFPGRATFGFVLRSAAFAGAQPLRAFLARPRQEVDAGWLEKLMGAAVPTFSPCRYEMTLPRGAQATAEEALRLMRLFGTGSDEGAESAIAALSGGARGPDGAIAVRFTNTAWSSLALVDLNADPDLRATEQAPLSPAMRLWRAIGRSGADIVEVDLHEGAGLFDYNPAAMGVADHPCTFEAGALRPAIPLAGAAHELVSAAARCLDSQGSRVVPVVPSGLLSWYAGAFPAVGVYSDWDDAAADEQLAAWRACAGAEPLIWRIGVADDFNDTESYLRTCLFWGFLPGFGADYAAHADWVERDRGALAVYGPLVRRLAAAGWRPVSPFDSGNSDIEIESFGVPGAGISHITMRNRTDDVLAGQVLVPAASNEALLLDPLTGEVRAVPAGGVPVAVPIRLTAGQITLWTLIPLDRIEDELHFLDTWTTPSGDGAAIRRSLESMRAEMATGVQCRVTCPMPAVRGEDNRMQVEVVNRSAERVVVRDLKIITSKQFRPFEKTVQAIEPGGRSAVVGFFSDDDLGDNPWVEAQWVVECGDTNLLCTRMLKPEWTVPLEFRPSATRVEGSGPTVVLGLRIRNFSDEPREVDVKWEGDFKGGRWSEILPPGAVRQVELPVAVGRKVRAGQMFVTAEAGKQVVYQQWFDVSVRTNPSNEGR